MLFSYKIAEKIMTRYILYQLVYGLHLLMPTKHIVLVVGGNHRDNTSVIVLTSRVLKLEKLQEARMQVAETIRI
jgi:hypothetical protein